MENKNFDGFFEELSKKCPTKLQGVLKTNSELDALAALFLPSILESFDRSGLPLPDEHWRVGLCLDAFEMAEAFVIARSVHQERKDAIWKGKK